jgi:hypothetical protein
MVRIIIITLLICSVVGMVVQRCRSCTSLGAHPAHWRPSEYDRWALAAAHRDRTICPLRRRGVL